RCGMVAQGSRPGRGGHARGAPDPRGHVRSREPLPTVMGTAQGLLVRAVALGALAFSVLWPRSALADAVREAAADHFDRGLAYVDQREFSLAVQEFERAYELGRHFGVLYNLGLAYAAVGR